MLLPAGYRVVAWLSVVGALLIGSCVGFGQAMSFGTKAVPVLYGLVSAVFFVSPLLGLLLGGCLLLSNSPKRLQAATWVLFATAVVLFLEVAFVTAGIVQEMRHPTISTGAMVLADIAYFIMPASIWGVTILVTGFLLRRRLREQPNTIK